MTASSEAARVRDLVAHSRELIVTHQHASGAFPAAPAYRVYRYCWFRDGAFIADGLSRHGEVEPAEAFHEWCAARVVERKDVVADVVARVRAGTPVPHEDFLPTRYTLDGELADEDWWDFQTDGYGSWLWALGEHLRRHGRDGAGYRDAVAISSEYLQHVWRERCYDWWEETPDQRHTSTLLSIMAGLGAALGTGLLEPDQAASVARERAAIGRTLHAHRHPDGHLVKWPGSRRVDGSLLAGIAPFAVVDASTSVATLAAVETDLVHEHGVYRYLDDTFYGGGRWPVLAAFHGLALLRHDRPAEAHATLRWITSTATADGHLPEQVGPRLLHPEREPEWVQRWGPVATPLLWSHGMHLTLAAALGIRL